MNLTAGSFYHIIRVLWAYWISGKFKEMVSRNVRNDFHAMDAALVTQWMQRKILKTAAFAALPFALAA